MLFTFIFFGILCCSKCSCCSVVTKDKVVVYNVKTDVFFSMSWVKHCGGLNTSVKSNFKNSYITSYLKSIFFKEQIIILNFAHDPYI